MEGSAARCPLGCRGRAWGARRANGEKKGQATSVALAGTSCHASECGLAGRLENEDSTREKTHCCWRLSLREHLISQPG